MNNKFKEDLCNAVISDYCREKGVCKEELTSEDIYAQSTLGIALQYLGCTSGWAKEDFDYINNRSGVIQTYMGADNKPSVLTLRDILEN